jgi:hypothetical protein
VSFIPLFTSYQRKTATATADTPFQLVFKDMWWNFVDIFVYDNAAYVGDVSDQDVLVNAGDIYTIMTPVNVYALFFKNVTASSNTRIVIAGTPMTKKQGQDAGIVVE